MDLITEACICAWTEGRPTKAHQRKPKRETENPNILVTTYHPTFNDLSKIVRKNWETLARSARTKALHEKPLIISLRRPPNLQSQIVRAKTFFHPDNPLKIPSAISGHSYNICYNKDCRYCPKINKEGKITSKATKRTYRLGKFSSISGRQRRTKIQYLVIHKYLWSSSSVLLLQNSRKTGKKGIFLMIISQKSSSHVDDQN